jgi:DNA primase
MGAGNWRSEHSAFLAGADVVIVPDNDEPGRDHADAVGTSLQGIAKSVRILELPGLEPKQDIVDWAGQGGTVEQLHDLIAREARPWTPRQKPEQPAGNQGEVVNATSATDTDVDDRPTLTLSAGNLHDLATRAESQAGGGIVARLG